MPDRRTFVLQSRPTAFPCSSMQVVLVGSGQLARERRDGLQLSPGPELVDWESPARVSKASGLWRRPDRYERSLRPLHIAKQATGRSTVARTSDHSMPVSVRSTHCSKGLHPLRS